MTESTNGASTPPPLPDRTPADTKLSGCLSSVEVFLILDKGKPEQATIHAGDALMHPMLRHALHHQIEVMVKRGANEQRLGASFKYRGLSQDTLDAVRARRDDARAADAEPSASDGNG